MLKKVSHRWLKRTPLANKPDVWFWSCGLKATLIVMSPQFSLLDKDEMAQVVQQLVQSKPFSGTVGDFLRWVPLL